MVNTVHDLFSLGTFSFVQNNTNKKTSLWNPLDEQKYLDIFRAAGKVDLLLRKEELTFSKTVYLYKVLKSGGYSTAWLVYKDFRDTFVLMLPNKDSLSSIKLIQHSHQVREVLGFYKGIQSRSQDEVHLKTTWIHNIPKRYSPLQINYLETFYEDGDLRDNLETLTSKNRIELVKHLILGAFMVVLNM